MFGNGIANVAAAGIIAAAILWTGGAQRSGPASGPQMDEKALAEFYARAVGDIRNDIVINCGCCGEEAGKRERRADAGSF